MTVNAAQIRCNEVVANAIRSGENVLVEALPGLGKTYSTAKAAVEGGHPITYLTHRTGLREEVLETALWLGLPREGILFLKPADKTCETLLGEHGEEAKQEAEELMKHGLTPGDLHQQESLPCQEGSECSYTSMWEFESGDYMLIIGHPTHAHVPKAVESRVLVFDEFPEEAFLTDIDDLHGGVDPYIADREDLPFYSHHGILNAPKESREEALKAFRYDSAPIERNVETALSKGSHVLAPLATMALLSAEELENGYHHATGGLMGQNVGACWEGKHGYHMTLLTPPDLWGARGVVALDGTPTRELWEAVLGVPLLPQPVLNDEEKADYLRGQGLRFIQTTEASKPYSSGQYVNVQEDAALLHEVREVHGERPSIVTSRAAREAYAEEGLLHEYVDNHQLYFGNMRGSNSLRSKRVGIVLGSPHHGDGKLKKWGALLGESVEPARVGGQRRTVYGETGERLLKHVREAEVLQAALRFGRDGEGATVYLHTSALPEWLLLEEGSVRPYKTKGKEAAILSVLREGDPLTVKEIAEEAGVTPQYVRRVLKRLDVEEEQDSMDKRVRRYSLKGDANPYGEVDLSPCESIAQVPKQSPIILSNRGLFRNPCYSVSVEECLNLEEVSLIAKTTSPSDWIRWSEPSEEVEI